MGNCVSRAIASVLQNLTHEAIRKRNSRDNVSVILIILNKWY
jgi:serine/threonine protein phosphatase PrpC